VGARRPGRELPGPERWPAGGEQAARWPGRELPRPELGEQAARWPGSSAAAGPGEVGGRGRRARRTSPELGGRGGRREGRDGRWSWACGVAGEKGAGRRCFPNGGGGLRCAISEQQRKRAERKASGGYFLARRQDLWRRARCHAGCHVTMLGAIGCGAELC
jgi:hypothetical protein